MKGAFLVPRPHYSARPKPFRSCDPSKDVCFQARSPRILHRSELIERDWENVVQRLFKLPDLPKMAIAKCTGIQHSIGFLIPHCGFRIQSIPCQWKWNFRFQSLVGFQIPWAESYIPKPRTPDSEIRPLLYMERWNYRRSLFPLIKEANRSKQNNVKFRK